jgi:hypothetical protein
MGAEERPQQLEAQRGTHAASSANAAGADATVYRREEAQELNHELARDLQNAAAVGKSPSEVSPATPLEQDGLASRESSRFHDGWWALSPCAELPVVFTLLCHADIRAYPLPVR